MMRRAKYFGSKLRLGPEWLCVDQPYFNAPGESFRKQGLELVRHISSVWKCYGWSKKLRGRATLRSLSWAALTTQ